MANLSIGTCFDYILKDTNEFQKAMQYVTDRANYNSSGILPKNYGGYYVEFTKDLVRNYISLVCDKSLPEYDLKDQANKEKIEQTVAKMTNYDLGKTKEIFKEFYYATFGDNKGNSIAQKYIYPLSAFCQYSGCETQPHSTDFTVPSNNPFNSVVSTTSSILSKYLVPGLVAVGGLTVYALYKKNHKKNKRNK